jgi:hypothetical protein
MVPIGARIDRTLHCPEVHTLCSSPFALCMVPDARGARISVLVVHAAKPMNRPAGHFLLLL